MKKVSIICCLVLLLNMFCPAAHAHAEEITTPTDLPCEHIVSTWSRTDNSQHRGICLSCGETVDGYHNGSSIGYYDDEHCLFVCKDCGTEFTGEHQYVADPENGWFSDETHHYYMCGYCGEKVLKGEHYGALCWTDYSCMGCGAEYDYDPDDIKHRVLCNSTDGKCDFCLEDGGADAITIHDWTYAPVYVEPTCTTDGSYTDECKGCGEKSVEVLPAFGHSLVNVITNDATCTTNGSRTGVCTICNKMITESIPSISHAWGDPVTVDATCTADGSKTTTCTVCGEQTVETILATGHSYIYNHDGEGYHWEYCTNCRLMQNYEKHFTYCDQSDRNTCIICATKVESDLIDLEHTTTEDTTWEWDEYTHWYMCVCGEYKFENWGHSKSCTATACETCGYEGEILNSGGGLYHRFDNNYEYDERWHWSTCVDCGVEEQSTHWNWDCTSDICMDCGAEFENTQHYGLTDEFEFDENGHWYTCTLCGEITEPEAHSFNCTTPTTCHCGYETQENVRLIHWWTEKFTDCGDYHAKLCPKCGEETYVVSHDVACTNPGVCATCGATGVSTDIMNHTLTGYQSDETSHWNVCKDCGKKCYETEHYANCDTLDTCVACNAQYDNMKVSGHDVFGSKVYHDETSHWRVCNVCGDEVNRQDHVEFCYDVNGSCVECGLVGEFDLRHDVLKADMETDDANHWKVCAICDDGVDKAEHLDENTDGKCDVCEKSVTHVHTWGEPETVEATCTTDGSKTTNCTVCGEKTVEIIGATGHTFSDAVMVEPTCTTDGSKTGTCTICGEATVEIIPATGAHIWETDSGTAATCTSVGFTEKTCALCGETDTTTTAAKGHTYGLVFVTEGNGTHAKTCADCGNKHIESCTLTSTELGNMVCSVCATCGYAVYTMSDVALETVENLIDTEAKIEVKRVENVSFEIVVAPAEEGVEAETEPMDVSDVVLVVHETELEMTVELPDTVTASVKKVLAVSLLKEGASIQPSSKVKLSIPVVEEEVAGMKLVLMTESGELIEIEYEIIDGVLVFETEAVGVFLFVEAEE